MTERRGREPSLGFLLRAFPKRKPTMVLIHINLRHLVHSSKGYHLELNSALLKSHRILQRYSTTWEIRFLILYIEADEVKSLMPH